MKKSDENSGIHLTLDGFTHERRLLCDMNLIYGILDDIPAKVGLNKLTKPLVVWDRDCSPDNVGISGFIMIKESHISIHTFPERGFVAIDVYSCKGFDVEDVLAFFTTAFKFERCEKHVIHRIGLAGNTQERKLS